MKRWTRAAACWAAMLAPAAHAALPDEIQVYTGDINKPGEWGFEVHVNTTPSGRKEPDFPGEIVPHHAWRVTPEISYGVSPTIDVGVYLPFVFAPGGTQKFSGPKLRAKWLPIQVPEGGAGMFAGVNVEYAWIDSSLEEVTREFEVRPIIGWEDERWLVAFNPILEFAQTGPTKNHSPEFNPALKIGRKVQEGIMAGIEYYGALGALNNFDTHSEQSHTLYLALDVERGPVNFNFGIGRGMSGTAADKWTVKAIFEIPIGGK